MKRGTNLFEIILFIIIGSVAFYLYGRLKVTIMKDNNSWIVIQHANESKSNVELYKLQHILKSNGIKSKVEIDDQPLTNALKSYFTDKSDTVLKLLVLEKDYPKAVQLIETKKKDCVGHHK